MPENDPAPKTDPAPTAEPKPAEPAAVVEPAATAEPKETDWKAEARKWEQRAKDNKRSLDEAAPKLKAYGEWEAASKTELEKANEKAQEYEDRAVELTLRAVRAEVRSRAAGFVHTDVPFAYIDPSNFLDDKGDIDTAKIDSELADLLKQHPELARPAGSRAPGPNPAQGSSAGGEPDLDAQKQEALKKGDWRAVMRIENQKLYARQPGT